MKIAIIFIGVSVYLNFWDDFYQKTQQNFIPESEKHFFVFSDNTPIKLKSNVTHLKIDFCSPRNVKLNKFHYIHSISNTLKDFDFVFYFDADNHIQEVIPLQKLLNWFSETIQWVGVLHPWGYIRQQGRFESNPKSAAFIETKEPYLQSCFWGCKGSQIVPMSKTIDTWIQQDQQIHHINQHKICDEIYFNKFYVLHKDQFHKLDAAYANPGSPYQKATNYKFPNPITIEHDNACQFQTWKQHQTPFHISIGAYFQVYKRCAADYVSLKQYRNIHPISPIILWEDGGDDYVDLAQKFQCARERSELNNGTWRNRTTITNQITYLQRLKQACETHLSMVDWVIILSPDVETLNPITKLPRFGLCGPARGPTWTPLLRDFIQSHQHPDIPFNPHYTGCCGSIFNRKMFLLALEQTPLSVLEKAHLLDERVGKAEDSTLTFLFQWNNFETGGWEDFTGWKDPNKSQFAMVHGNKEYYNKPLKIEGS